MGAPISLVSRVGEGDGLLLSADRNPNLRGALVTGLIKDLPPTHAPLAALAAAIESGEVKTVVSVGEDLGQAGLSAEQLAKVEIIYLGTQADTTSEAAAVVLPTLTVFEKSGTFINQQFRIQKFAKAVPGPAGVADDLVTLSALITATGGGESRGTVDAVWAALAAQVPELAGLTYCAIPDDGLLLDATPYVSLPFVEGETLHYKPASAEAAPAPEATTTAAA